MRKTKILKRLVATTFALALVLSGIIPGMEPLEVQAESVTITTQISTEELYDRIEDDDFILGQGASISFSQGGGMTIDDVYTPYEKDAVWTNDSSQEYWVYGMSYSDDYHEVILQSCEFSGDYSIQVWFDHAFDYGTRETSAFTFELGTSTTMSKDDIIAGMYEKFPSSVVIKDDKLYKDNSCTSYYTDIVDASKGEVYMHESTYDIILDVFVLVGSEGTINTPSSSIPSSTPKETKEEEKPVEVPKTPETHYGTFQEDAINKVQTAIVNINKATTNGTTSQTKKVELNTGVWVSFHKSVYEEIQKCNLPVTITFIHEGTRYVVTIPSNANVLSLVDENGYCGFLNLGAHYGYDSIEKLW